VTNGDHRFNYHRYRRYLDKTTNSNPRHGPFHMRAPSEMFRKAVRGMCNYKTGRGGAAFKRLKVFEGVPARYEKAGRVVVPHALRAVALGGERSVTALGTLATTFGWRYGRVVAGLEAKRLERSQLHFEGKKAESARRARALATANRALGADAVRFLDTCRE